MVTKPTIWPQGRFGVPQITPYTYPDGQTLLELITALRDHVVDQLHPNLQKAIDQLVTDVETEYDKAHDRYVDGVQEFQRIHDSFMSDVNASLVALNDGAVSDLVQDDTSLLGQVMREIFTDRKSFTDLSDTLEYRFNVLKDENKDFQDTLVDTVDTHVNDLRGEVASVQHRIDARRKVAHHTEYGVTDLASLRDALAVLPTDTILTLPEDMEFEIGDDELVLDRPVSIRGGVFHGTGHVIRITSDHVHLEDLRVYGNGNTLANHESGANAIYALGTTTRPLTDITLDNVTVHDVGYTGIRLTHVQNFRIQHCTVEHFRYAGIAVSSVKGGVILHNRVGHANADASVNWNTYGISVSNSTHLDVSHRSEDVDVMFNTIYDIPHWEGIDTHNGKNIDMSYNHITGCRRGIALVANMTEPLSGPTDCRVVGNSIDASGASQEHFQDVIGITMGGNTDNTRKSDAIIMGNTIRNASTPLLFMPDRPERYTWEKCSVHSNVGDPGQVLPGTTFDTGWVGIANHMEWGGGVASAGDYQMRVRVIGDEHGYTTYLRGAVTRNSATNLLFRFTANSAHLVPDSMAYGHQERHIIGTVTGVSSNVGTAMLFVERDRRIRFGNVKGSIGANDNLFIDAVIRA